MTMLKKIDQEKVTRLCQARDEAKARATEALMAKDAASKAYETAFKQYGAARRDLDKYLQECTGDPGFGSYLR
jgi:hypothetical protein